jgi:NAD(P)-dependent dehydrogenase (short-subunit alcohol dehydrogenase family)
MTRLLPTVFDLSGRLALVTGAASGLGAMIAITMAEAGADVVCADVNKDGLDEVTANIRRFGRKTVGVQCDISREEDVVALFAQAQAAFGRLDICFNNAGIADAAPTMIHEYDTNAWNRVMSVDLQGVFYCCRAALKQMMTVRRGKVINVASMWGLVGSSGLMPFPAYCAAKGAVVNFTRELGLEYAPHGINVNALCPGFFRTNIGGGSSNDPQFRQAAIDYTPMKRMAEAEEIKGSALYLASSATDFMCGHTLVIDGGALAG